MRKAEKALTYKLSSYEVEATGKLYEDYEDTASRYNCKI